jgi:lipopolysaccharide biosynthesis glycosyltransferase
MKPAVAVCVNNDASHHIDHVYNSIVANGGPIDFHVVAHPNVPEDRLQHYKDRGYTVHKRGQWPELDTGRLRCKCPLRTQAVFYRWLLPELVDTPRVIYMDTDVVVVGDIRELWDMPLGDAYAAMARDPFCKDLKAQWSFLASYAPAADTPLKAPALISGLTVINSEVWRAENVKDQLVDIFDRNPMEDQLAMGILFKDRVKLLDESWAVPIRYCNSTWYCSKTDIRYTTPKFLHWHGSLKPWHKKGSVPFREIYEKYV